MFDETRKYRVTVEVTLGYEAEHDLWSAAGMEVVFSDNGNRMEDGEFAAHDDLEQVIRKGAWWK